MFLCSSKLVPLFLHKTMMKAMHFLSIKKTDFTWRGLPKFTGFKGNLIVRVLVDLQHILNYIPQKWLHKIELPLQE